MQAEQVAMSDMLTLQQLTFPPGFGSAYAGETFLCTLCANNELPANADRIITSVKITAEMQVPSGPVLLDLTPSDDETTRDRMEQGESLQKIVRFHLKEEGNYVLAVSLSYSETTVSEDRSASSGRIRTFRKLYRFDAQPCLRIRTKVSDFPPTRVDGREQVHNITRFAVEAQLENMAEGSLTLEQIQFSPKQPFRSTSLNWDLENADTMEAEMPILVPRDVAQVAFLIENRADDSDEIELETQGGRTVLGQLSVQWRTAFGNQGCLDTGWLMTKRR